MTMEILAFVFGFGSVLVVGIYLWTFSKSGKKWLENL